MGRVVVAFGASEADFDVCFPGLANSAEDESGAKPGVLLAILGKGGGGIRSASVSTFGTLAEARCALLRAGKAGGSSSSMLGLISFST